MIIAIVVIALVVVAAGTMLAVRTTTLRRSRRPKRASMRVEARFHDRPSRRRLWRLPLITGVASGGGAASSSQSRNPSRRRPPTSWSAPRRALASGSVGRARRSRRVSPRSVDAVASMPSSSTSSKRRSSSPTSVFRRRTRCSIPSGRRFEAPSSDPDAVLLSLKGLILGLFDGDDPTLTIGPEHPSVWLFVGVNGVGKTTTIGKLAYREKNAGHSVVLAAGDTFRAAAGEQLDVWAKRTNSEIVQGADGADPSSVIFDGIAHAGAISADLVLADTAGRLHTKSNLMEELRKVRRIADRPPGHVTEVLLVIDATTGQNGLTQAREFSEAVGVTGHRAHQARRQREGWHRARDPFRARAADQARRPR